MSPRSMLVPLLLVLATAPAIGQDVEGSSDHPLVGRFTGSTIIYYKASADDQAALLQAPHDYGVLLDRDALADRSGGEWLPVEGRVTRIRYQMPPGHGSLEVSKSYRAALEAQGFAVLFECADAACLTGSLTDDYLLGQQLDTDNYDTTRYSTHIHYFLAALGAPSMPSALPDPGEQLVDLVGNGASMEQDMAMPAPPQDPGGPGSPPTDIGGPGSPADIGGPGSPADPGGPGSPAIDMVGPGSPMMDTADPNAMIAGPADGCQPTDLMCGANQPTPGGPADAAARAYVAILVGEDQALTTAFVEVVEPAGGTPDPSANVAVVDAQQMAVQLGDSGTINIYGLHFGIDSAALQPDSRPTLDQIWQLLQAQPTLRLAVVGHTDNQGSAAYNLQLSARRAQSVVAALVSEYGIDPGRLEPSGRGLTQPIASNDTQDGRAQNRRVELIALQ